MRDLTILLVHLITTVFCIVRLGGVRSVVAESVLMKHQLLIVNRSRRRAPNLRVLDRLIAGFCSLWITPKRLLRSAVAFKPTTLLNFHRALVQRKYRFTWECSAALPEARCRRLTRPRTWRESGRLHRRRARPNGKTRWRSWGQHWCDAVRLESPQALCFGWTPPLLPSSQAGSSEFDRASPP